MFTNRMCVCIYLPTYTFYTAYMRELCVCVSCIDAQKHPARVVPQQTDCLWEYLSNVHIGYTHDCVYKWLAERA